MITPNTPIPTRVFLKSSDVAGEVPPSEFISFGELALNRRDGIIYAKGVPNGEDTVWLLFRAAQVGQTQITSGTSSTDVIVENLTAQAIIVCTLASLDTTLKYVTVVTNPSGGGFTIHGNAAATSNCLVNYSIVQP